MSGVMSEWPSNSFEHFLLVICTSSHEWYNIDIYMQRTTELLTPIIKSFVTLKVLIQNERIRWFTVQTLRSVFVQGIVRVRYSPSLLSLWTFDIMWLVSYELLLSTVVTLRMYMNITINMEAHSFMAAYIALHKKQNMYYSTYVYVKIRAWNSSQPLAIFQPIFPIRLSKSNLLGQI